MKSPPPPLAYRPYLDQIRWISAALVAVGHALGILNSHVQNHNLLGLIANLRGGAVIVFFILSGYLVGGSVVRDFDRFNFGRYAIARLSRIYVVLIPALLLTLVLDGSVLLFDPHNPVYDRVWQGGALGESPILSRFSIKQLVGTVLSVEPITGRPVGSAGSLWSLGFEWIFYFAFPLTYGIGYRLRNELGASVAILLSLVVVFVVSKIDAAFWLVWLLGAYASVVERKGWLQGRTWTPWLKTIASLIVVGFVFAGDSISHQIGIPIAGFAGLIFLACGDGGEKRLITHADTSLAHFSYSLYVIHLQIMTAMTAALVRFGIVPLEGLVNWWEIIGLSAFFLAASVAAAYGFGQLFESRTHDLSRALHSRLLRPSLPTSTTVGPE